MTNKKTLNKWHADRGEASTCAHCGEKYWLNYSAGLTLDRMKSDGLCFICAHWQNSSLAHNSLVIDGYLYSLGGGSGGGMGGRKFVIEYFDGNTVTTNDLWAGGAVPERHRKAIPNTARFAGGAKREVVGGITCWDSSS